MAFLLDSGAGDYGKANHASSSRPYAGSCAYKLAKGAVSSDGLCCLVK